jgi:DNA-binding protein Fis
VFDAVSLHKERVLSMDSFIKAVSARGLPLSPISEHTLANPFAQLERLPTFTEVIELLVEEGMIRASGNQTIAARLLGVSQPALSKRLKSSRK